MLDVENDARYQSITQELKDYAEKTRQWQISRRYYTKGGGNKFQFSDKYPYDDAEERDKIDSYLLSLNRGDQEVANGKFLKEYKSYLVTPFAKHAIDLASHSISDYPLSDKDKIEFLKDIFSSGKQHKFDKHILYKLADYNPNANLEASNHLYNKAVGYFSGANYKNDENMALVYGMFKIFAQNVVQVSPEAVVNYANLYFRMAERTDKELDASVLVQLATKTPYGRKIASQSGDESFLDKGTLKKIFKAYADYVSENPKINGRLGNQMKQIADNVKHNYEYTLQEVIDLAEMVRPAEVGKNGKKIRPNDRRAYLSEMADEILSDPRDSYWRQRNPLKHIDLDNPPAALEDDKVLEYADYLFKTAKINPQHDFHLGGLVNLLNKDGKHNKKLLLDVVDAYGQSLSASDMENGYYNEFLHNKMTKMLQEFIVNWDYTPEDINVLRQHIEQGGGGHEEFLEMGRVVKTASMLIGDWRYELSRKPPAVSPIVHQVKSQKSL